MEDPGDRPIADEADVLAVAEISETAAMADAGGERQIGRPLEALRLSHSAAHGHIAGPRGDVDDDRGLLENFCTHQPVLNGPLELCRRKAGGLDLPNRRHVDGAILADGIL